MARDTHDLAPDRRPGARRASARADSGGVVRDVLRTALRGVVGGKADEVVIVYGGSVNRSNVKELLSADGVDGLLVGGASLDPEAWAAICRT